MAGTCERCYEFLWDITPRFQIMMFLNKNFPSSCVCWHILISKNLFQVFVHKRPKFSDCQDRDPHAHKRSKLMFLYSSFKLCVSRNAYWPDFEQRSVLVEGVCGTHRTKQEFRNFKLRDHIPYSRNTLWFCNNYVNMRFCKTASVV
jgi:hypothetical protein